ncbi:putative reverse transcriptase domain-containing protein [Helianthus annuus]|nr:putative reverse transcriptase domain-containing protein [Helianthus annuus]KAJ0906832.1 putative reverse transcriptase domain-containing protein [Helianthus annuus]
MRRAKRRCMLFKVDLEKGYDSLCWKYLLSILEQMHFPRKWVNWISAILSMAWSSALVNGSPTGEFESTRGLTQRDPISPYLFILAMGGLTCMMKRACCLSGIYNGISLANNGPSFSHLLFVDDVLFLGEWSPSNALMLKSILRCFSFVSALS